MRSQPHALILPCLLSRTEMLELKKLFWVRANYKKGLKSLKNPCWEAGYIILRATWHQCDYTAAGSRPVCTQTIDDCWHVKYSQASEISFSNPWSLLIPFFYSYHIQNSSLGLMGSEMSTGSQIMHHQYLLQWHSYCCWV